MEAASVGALEAFLREVGAVRRSGAGVDEASYYPAVHQLLSTVGQRLDPPVFCLSQPKSRGAGRPDFMLYSSLAGASLDAPLPDRPPDRGVVEVKAPRESVEHLRHSEQALRYWEEYGLTLLTNLRRWLVMGKDAFGRRIALEDFELSPSGENFFDLCADPKGAQKRIGARFEAFLARFMLLEAPLSRPREVAWLLASYAREALWQMEGNPEPQNLELIRRALEETLGMRFEGEKGRHFFHSTYVQTLFYGLFSSWVLWWRRWRLKAEEGEAGKIVPELIADEYHFVPTSFTAGSASWQMDRLPALGVLFEQARSPGNLGPLRMFELLSCAAGVLRRIDQDAFFKVFDEEHAVPYFYEPFLEAFDPGLRKDLGVWYTPPEVVDYMVARVDRALREDLGIADGLADERVYVLDPCAGTGSFLMGVLRRIRDGLKAKHGDALIRADLQKAATERLVGFEILPAPYVVAYLQSLLFLEGEGVSLAGWEDRQNGQPARLALYLTNALTGWEEAERDKWSLPFPELQNERDGAHRVKREKPVLVVIGNPPYNGFAGAAMDEEMALGEAYRTTRRVRRPEGQGLNDLYVRFFRMAERRIVEATGEGVVCLISNYSWLDGLSYTGMRERFLEAFDSIRIDCLNGDKYRTGKLTPDGRPDPSIFSTDLNREGIQVGTAIATMVRKKRPEGGPSGSAEVLFRHFWGKDKRRDLASGAERDGRSLYTPVAPVLELGLPFQPTAAAPEYFRWPLLTDLLPVSFPGVKTSRDQFLVAIDRSQLERRLNQYFDPTLTHEEVARLHPQVMKDTGRFKARDTRDFLLRRGRDGGAVVRYAYRPFDNRWLYWDPDTKLLDEKRTEYFSNHPGTAWHGGAIVRYWYRPFDRRWLYWDPDTDLLDRKRSEYVRQLRASNLWLCSIQQARREKPAPFVARHLGSLHVMERGGSYFPLYLRGDEEKSLLDGEAAPNLSAMAARYLADLEAKPEDLFHHIVAVLHAPGYEAENSDGARLDWPRIPLPSCRAGLEDSAALGREVAALLDPEAALPGLARPPLRVLGLVAAADGSGRSLGPGDLALRARWGVAGQDGVCMPGPGRSVARPWSAAEREALGSAILLLGETCRDVHLNDMAVWQGVPEPVWSYTLGGYQVVKKWLSYREETLLGRPLIPDEAREVSAMVRRIAALLLLAPRLDANYRSARRAGGQRQNGEPIPSSLDRL
ncbi:MAG: N-6 DNA methylase [Magnetospirillum sp. WYHS-4]